MRINVAIALSIFLCLDVGATDLSRREFLRSSRNLTFFWGAGVLSGLASAKVLDTLPIEQKNPNITYTQTAIEQNFVLIGQIITYKILEAKFGKGRFDNNFVDKEQIEVILRNPKWVWIQLVAITPLLEETLARLLPGIAGGHGWNVGIVSAAIFAAAHSLAREEPMIPVIQFIAGIWFWYLFTHRGIDHAILAHAWHNNMAFFDLLKVKKNLEIARSCDSILVEGDIPLSKSEM